MVKERGAICDLTLAYEEEKGMKENHIDGLNKIRHELVSFFLIKWVPKFKSWSISMYFFLVYFTFKLLGSEVSVNDIQLECKRLITNFNGMEKSIVTLFERSENISMSSEPMMVSITEEIEMKMMQ